MKLASARTKRDAGLHYLQNHAGVTTPAPETNGFTETEADRLQQWRDSIRERVERDGWRKVLFEEWHWDLKNTDKTVYDLICDGLTKEEFESYRDSIVWELNPTSSDTVLNIGCGIGRVEKFLSPMVSNAIGLDISAEMVALAKERCAKNPNLKFLVCDGESLAPIEDCSVDLVFSELVFQHIPKHVAFSYIKEAHRVLRPGGRGIIQVPTELKYGEMPQELCAFMTAADLKSALSIFESVTWSRHTNDYYLTPVFQKGER